MHMHVKRLMVSKKTVIVQCAEFVKFDFTFFRNNTIIFLHSAMFAFTEKSHSANHGENS